LGVPAYIVASTVEAVLAQRLVRLICQACRELERPSEEQLQLLGEERAGLSVVPVPRGCEECRGTGYRGRTGIYELLLMNDELRDVLVHQSGAGELRKMARKAGMRSLREDGIRLLRSGVTSVEELMRVTHE
jgi:type II secretory ATPase GspE/PulE/Tfp pilus assembly ATPase PilB-like protein